MLALLRQVAACGYQFTTPTPMSHRRVRLRRALRPARGLADVFGWSLPFVEGTLPADMVALMAAGGILRRRGGRLASALRIASVGPLLFWHSAFPPSGRDAVFFGPDSYRFADFIRAQMVPLPAGATIVDIGAGAGVGGLFAHALQPQARLILGDINPLALRLARINAAFAGLAVRCVRGAGLPPLEGPAELILANPPYLGGGPRRTYSDGGGDLGRDLAVAWARAALDRLSPGGRLLLYSGAPIVRGRDALREALEAVCAEGGGRFSYRELDADVFPETLLHRAYWGVERIAAVGAVLSREGPTP